FVVIKNSTCNAPSSVFLITAAEPEVGVAELRVHPNPTDAELVVEVPATLLPAEATIINTMGRLLFSGIADDDQMRIPTSNFSTGIYVVDIRTNGTLERRKILVQHYQLQTQLQMQYTPEGMGLP